MAVMFETLSSEIIKPSTVTPSHLRTYRMCHLDQLAPAFHVPVVLFYSASDANLSSVSCGITSVTERLKASLSEALSSFYPFSGRINESALVECNDQGARFVVARAGISLSKVLAGPDILGLQQFLPFQPYKLNSEEEAILGVKVSFFECGGVGIGVCLSHKIADGCSLAQFLVAWSQAALGLGENVRTKPRLDSSALFPPKDVNIPTRPGLISDQNLITKRFCFSGKGLARLRVGITGGLKPTRVEAVTALIWRAALEAATKARRLGGSGTFLPSAATHVVDIRSRAAPPLPEQTLGNLWQCVVASTMDVAKETIQLQDLVAVLRKSIGRVNGEFVGELQGTNGLAKACESLVEEERQLASGVELYRFTSWTRFPFYKTDFGWGRPAQVYTTGIPMKNLVVLMGMGSEDEGIEARVTLTEPDMIEFQANEQLLKFISNP